MYTIKQLDESHVTGYQEIAYTAYPSLRDFSDDGVKQYKELIADIIKNDPIVEFFGVFDSDKLISVARFFKFNMNCFGKMVTTGGLGFLGVDLIHKKKGAAKALIEYFDAYCQKENITLGLLLPFRPDYYKKFGYGFGVKMNQYRIKTGQLPPYTDSGGLRYIQRTELEPVLQFHENFTLKTHGMISKMRGEINDLSNDINNKIIAHYGTDGKINGYLIFQFLSGKEDNYTINHINVSEMVYDNPEVLRIFLGFLRKQEDQVQLIIFNTGIDAFHYLFENPLNDTNNYVNYGNIETNTQCIGMMYKCIGIADAFKQFDYRNYNNVNLTARFIINDDRTSKSKVEVTVKFTDGHASVLNSAEKDCDITVTIKQSDFSSLFMGCVSVKELLYLGRLNIDGDEHLDKLDLAFYCNPKPINNTDF